MIDLTKVQLFEVAPALIKLQSENKSLQNKNNLLRNILIGGGLIALFYFGNKIYKTYFKSEPDIPTPKK